MVVGVSGGKDSHAVVTALASELRGYEGPKLLVHADLGLVEWPDSLPACRRIAEAVGWELLVVKRAAGGMMERWESRWESSKRRYLELSTVAVVLPWSTASMRFCTSELKIDPITAALKKRYGRTTPVLSVTGVRAQESAARAKQPVSRPAAKLPAGSLAWSPILHWKIEDVWEAIRQSGVAAHEAYLKCGSGRVSCRFCILASQADLRASLKDPRSFELYRRMCDLELRSGFAFQARWLSEIAPDLLLDGVHRLAMAKELMAARQAAEAWIPKHLAFIKGWPHCVPSRRECWQLADMRSRICDLYGWARNVCTPREVFERYADLMILKNNK